VIKAPLQGEATESALLYHVFAILADFSTAKGRVLTQTNPEVIKEWKTSRKTRSSSVPSVQRSRNTPRTKSPAKATTAMINNRIPNPRRFSSSLTPLRYTDGIYSEMDNELARDNLENDLPAADRPTAVNRLPDIGDYM
jgi:hypothetical protein